MILMHFCNMVRRRDGKIKMLQYDKKNYLRAHSFTSLITNQHQDINSIPQINSLGDAFNGTFP